MLINSAIQSGCVQYLVPKEQLVPTNKDLGLGLLHPKRLRIITKAKDLTNARFKSKFLSVKIPKASPSGT